MGTREEEAAFAGAHAAGVDCNWWTTDTEILCRKM